LRLLRFRGGRLLRGVLAPFASAGACSPAGGSCWAKAGIAIVAAATTSAAAVILELIRMITLLVNKRIAVRWRSLREAPAETRYAMGKAN
jgi:hypothetical protein